MNCKDKFEHFPFPNANAIAGQPGMVTERQVLLGLEGDRLDERVLVCAANLCQRVHAGLEVLLISDNQELPARLARFFRELHAAGIGYRFFHKQGDLGWEIVRYVKTRKNIAFVVVESLEGREGEARAGQALAPVGLPGGGGEDETGFLFFKTFLHKRGKHVQERQR